jgi:hypothetical protein
MSKMIHFFATHTDLLDLLGEIESARLIHYVKAGMFETAELVPYDAASRVPDLGIIHVDAAHKGLILLIADVATPLVLRPVPQRRGGTRYAMDQKENPDTISLFPGGRFDDRTILAGDFGTCTDSPVSAALLKVVARSVRKQWVRVREYWVGPEAMKVLDMGGRLTFNLRAPREYDLRR